MRDLRRCALGVDVGGTFTKLVAADEKGVLLAKTQVPTDPHGGSKVFLRRLVRAARALERRLSLRADGVGIGIAGDVDVERGVLRYSPNLKPFRNFALRACLEPALGCPVSVHNDANMAAWGGFVLEFRRRCRNMVCITLGTGVGGGIILDGRLYSGSTGSAGEIGHMRVEPQGAPCACGARGCLEAYAGSYGIVRAASVLSGKPARALDPRSLAAAARRGDGAAREAWRRAGEALGTGVANLVYLFNPDAVLFVGGLSRAGSLLLDPVRRSLKAESFRVPFDHVRLKVAKTPMIGAMGAALFALEGGH